MKIDGNFILDLAIFLGLFKKDDPIAAIPETKPKVIQTIEINHLDDDEIPHFDPYIDIDPLPAAGTDGDLYAPQAADEKIVESDTSIIITNNNEFSAQLRETIGVTTVKKAVIKRQKSPIQLTPEVAPSSRPKTLRRII